MTINPNSAEARDIAHHMHAYTDPLRHAETGPLVIEGGEGIYVTDNSGKRYIEAMAGLWSTAVGFNEKRLVDVAAAQMTKLPYYHNFASRSHDPAIDLAEKLIALAPVPMSKVFFTNSGSEANDTALKMIWYRSNAMGKPEKKKIIARNRGYHGVTLAAASLTGLPNNHRSFDLPLPNIFHTTAPHFAKEGRPGESEEEFASRCADDLAALIEAEGADSIAAFFAEPVMGAGGVVTPPKTYWEKIQKVLAAHDILLVADEVICGFGRTGRMFGSETYDIKPDIMVMSKQLTSTYFPLSALMMNARVYDPIAEEGHKIGIFGHGYTSGGHPVGAAIALENLRIIEGDGLVENAAEVGAHLQRGLRALGAHPLVAEVRGIGLIAALELKPGATVGAQGAALGAALIGNGLITRAIVDSIAFCPPLIITRSQVDDILAIVAQGLETLGH